MREKAALWELFKFSMGFCLRRFSLKVDAHTRSIIAIILVYLLFICCCCCCLATHTQTHTQSHTHTHTHACSCFWRRSLRILPYCHGKRVGFCIVFSRMTQESWEGCSGWKKKKDIQQLKPELKPTKQQHPGRGPASLSYGRGLGPQQETKKYRKGIKKKKFSFWVLRRVFRVFEILRIKST